MLSCKGATARLSAEIDGELGLLDRWSLRLHQFICSDCRQAALNLRALVGSMRHRPPSAAQAAIEDGVDEAYVERVMEALARDKGRAGSDQG